MSTDLKTAVERAKALPPRQRQVLAGLGRGELAKETADALGVSTGTVSNTRTIIYRKIGVAGAMEAVRVATAAQLV